jgi:hypothetical protein
MVIIKDKDSIRVVILIQDSDISSMIALLLYYFSIGLSTMFPHSVHDPS